MQWWFRLRTWFERSGSDFIEQIIALLFLFVVPYQLAFEHEVEFNGTYVFDYVLDSVMLGIRLQHAVHRCRRAYDSRNDAGISAHRRASRRRRARRACLALLLVQPIDALLWGSSWQKGVPLLRLTRLTYAPIELDRGLRMLERSQAVPFTLSRGIRLFFAFALSIHWVGCSFYYISRQPGARHYASAPWRPNHDGEQLQHALASYLASSYWSVMSLTTTGHVDIIDTIDGERQGEIWEYLFAIVVVVVSTFVYIYVNANCTSLMLKLNTRLENYRTRMQGVELYLKRNEVSKDVQRAVRRHFRQSFDEDQKSSAVLDAMPRYMRRTVLQDIHMRTLRRAPILFGVDKQMVAHLCAVMRRVVLHPEELLCKQGDVMNEMYILEEGQLIQVVEPEGPEELLEPSLFKHSGRSGPRIPTYRMIHDAGTAVCELPVLFGLRQPASIEAVKQSTVLMLQKTDMSVLFKEFPTELEKVRNGVKARLRSNNDNETLDQIEKLCAPSHVEQGMVRPVPVKAQTSQHEPEDEDAKKRGIKQRLATLASLKADGDIDETEFLEQRRRILNGI